MLTALRSSSSWIKLAYLFCRLPLHYMKIYFYLQINQYITALIGQPEHYPYHRDRGQSAYFIAIFILADGLEKRP
jgi:hypothetical protein